MSHRKIAVTPAGRKLYLEVLKSYILEDSSIDEWHLWDNCRNPADREYINSLEATHQKVKVIRIANVDGSNLSINRFYRFCTDVDAFYIKMDDDLVYLPEGFGKSLYDRAVKHRDDFLWWSPLVINNAVCSWLIKYFSKVEITETVSCQCADVTGWMDPEFAVKIHQKFTSLLATGNVSALHVGDYSVSLSRFSINCLGFFGEDASKLGQQFCPPNVDDEEWLSACLPAIVQKPGRVVGDLVVSHFAFSPQEPHLLRSRILDTYYKVAGLEPVPYVVKRQPISQRVFLATRAWKKAAFAGKA